MIDVLLVEDELLARMSLRTMIDWERYGYQIVGECTDGDQAVPMIEKLEPNIVITDVKMERMQGHELVRHMHRHHPHICAIVLSGYGDYQYVRDTLNHNAVDYLIKNELTPETLVEVLDKAKQRMTLDYQIERSQDNLQALRQQFVLQLVSGQYVGDEAAIRHRLRCLRIRMGTARVLPVLLFYQAQTDGNFPQDIRKSVSLGFSVCNVVDEILREQANGMVVRMENAHALMLVSFDEVPNRTQMDERLKKLLRRIDFCLGKFLKLQVEFCIGKMARLHAIDESYANMTRQRAGGAPHSLAMEPRRQANAMEDERQAQLRAYSPPVRSALRMIFEDFREPISLTAVADKLGMNSSYLSTLFKAETGFGFVERLADVRLEHARLLMEKGDMKLKNIISESGFFSYQYFFGLFKRRFGMTPGEYMRRRKNLCEP